MATKEIKASRLQSAKTKLSIMVDVVSDDVNGYITSNATSKINAASKAVINISNSLVDAVDSLDLYLNTVAEAFQKLDDDMATNIKSNTDIFTFTDSSRKASEKFVADAKDSKERGYRAKLVEQSKLYNGLP